MLLIFFYLTLSSWCYTYHFLILTLFLSSSFHIVLFFFFQQLWQQRSVFRLVLFTYFVLAAFLHIIFPGLALKTAFELFYSKVGQHTSVGNYWNDPYHQPLYFNYSQFLPYVNNAIETNMSPQFKEGITKLKKMVLIGGPDDNVITPWESRYLPTSV